MKIGIDIRQLSTLDNKAGLYQYTYNLVSNLLSVDHSNSYTLLSSLRGFQGDERIKSNFILRTSGRLSGLFLNKLSIPVECLMGRLDIFHGPCFFVPYSLRCKSVVTIHDLMVLRHPEFLKPEWVVSIRKEISASVRRSDAVIAVSSFTKKEIMELLNIPEERIRVIHNGVSPIFRPIREREKIEEVKAKFGVEGPYLLFVGNIEPKKNIETLIYAYRELRNSTSFKYPLLIAGKKSWHFPAIWKLIQQHRMEKDIIFTDVINDDELACLYNGAELFVFPSLFEGFGIPVIEAMACGVTVVTSNRASIPEIADDAALLVDPMNVNDIAHAMYSMLRDDKLRASLRQKGIERAKLFSWEKAARETVSLYGALC